MTNYFWLNCGYNRFNHFEDLMNQVSIFDSSVHFNPSEGYAAFKRAQVGDQVIFYQVQNKIGLLGAGTVVKYEEPKRGQIKIHFKFEEKLMPLTKHYMERDNYLKQVFFKMKEQLLNPLSEDVYQLIMALGRGEKKVDRYFLMKEMDVFEAEKEYTIFVRTVNGIERNGFKHYKEMDKGDKVIIYRTAPERGIYGTAEVIEGMHKKPVIQGRTDSTAVTIKYTGDMTHRTIYDLDREPMLRAQYFLDEHWNESITEITKVQYDAMLNETVNEVKPPKVSYAEQLAKETPKPRVSDYVSRHYQQQPVTEAVKDKLIHLYIHKASQDIDKVLQQNTPSYIADPNWTPGTLYGQYVKEEEEVKLHLGLLIHALKDNAVIIEQIEQLNFTLLKPLMKAISGQHVNLPFIYEGEPAILSTEGGPFMVNKDFRIIGTTTKSVEWYKEKLSAELLKYIKFYQVK